MGTFNFEKIKLMSSKLPLLITLILLCALSGCMQFGIEGDCPKTPDSKFGKETIHGTFYDFNWDDKSRMVKKSNNDLGLFRVEYHTNALYSFVSLASLGLYVPVDVDYWIEAPKQIQRMPKKK